jgi:hypothetical protein
MSPGTELSREEDVKRLLPLVEIREIAAGTRAAVLRSQSA